MLPKSTSEVLFIAFLVSIGGCSSLSSGKLHSNQKLKQDFNNPNVQSQESVAMLKSAKILEGQRIAERLEQECNYYKVIKDSPGDTLTARRTIYDEFGGQQVIIIPWSSWNALSKSEKVSLTNFVSTYRGVKKVIAGTVKPSNLYYGNTISLDETVWP